MLKERKGQFNPIFPVDNSTTFSPSRIVIRVAREVEENTILSSVPRDRKSRHAQRDQVSPLDSSLKNKLSCQTESCIYLVHDIPWDTRKYWKARLFSQIPSSTGRAGTLK